nr:putative ribonuclease H-like domain-containing protein [Tanacetum cinerariifolium]
MDFRKARLFKPYSSSEKEDILLIQVYVDDIAFGSTKKELCTEFEKLMHDKLQISSMGEFTFFLGLQVKQKSDGIFISQDKYINEILRKFKYTDVKPANTSVDKEKDLLKDSDGDDVDVHLYSIKAEYVAAASCYGQVLWIQNQLLDYRRSTKNMVEFDIGQEDDKV